MNRCSGCGAILQNSNSNKEGYTENLENKFCERCFNITHYNKYKRTEYKDYFKIIQEIDKSGDLIILVTDFLNLYNLDNLNFKSPVLLVLTKKDLLPRNVDERKILNSIKLNTVFRLFVSSKNNYNFDLLYEKILEYKTSNKVYVIGYTNAGKSTLINKLLYNYTDNKGDITVSNLPSTTLDLIEKKFNDLILIDTPGLLDENSMVLMADSAVLKKITPTKEIKPIIYQINSDQTILIENLVRLDLKKNTKIIIYMAKMNYQRIYKDNDKLVDLDYHQISIKKNYDLVIKGMGFITFKTNSTFNFGLPKNVEYIIRESII
jgi:ribosome biogenesis GTPase A